MLKKNIHYNTTHHTPYTSHQSGFWYAHNVYIGKNERGKKGSFSIDIYKRYDNLTNTSRRINKHCDN